MSASWLVKVYDLHDDPQSVKLIQDTTLYTKEHGLKLDHGLLGSKEWWQAIDQGVIPKRMVEGTISRVYMSGHNDFPEFEVSSAGTKTNWERKGDEKYYVTGRKVKVVYVLQQFKNPIEIRGRKGQGERITQNEVVVEIWLENSE